MKMLLCLLAMAGFVLAGGKGIFDGVTTVTTLDERVYEGVMEVRPTPAYVTVMHEGGVARVPWEQMPEEIRTAYGYDPAVAAAFLSKERAIQVAMERAVDRDLEVLERRRAAAAAKKERERAANELFAEMRRINARYRYPSAPARAVPTSRPNGTGYRYYTTQEGRGVWLRPEE